MSKGVNKVIIIGYIGKDPDVRSTQSGAVVANISVATSERWKDKQSGEPQERTEWHKVVMFGKLGEIADRYLKKGSQVYIEGRLQTRKWQDKSGQDRYSTEIVANDMQMLGGRGASENSGGRATPSPEVDRAKPVEQSAESGVPFDDDIPF